MYSHQVWAPTPTPKRTNVRGRKVNAFFFNFSGTSGISWPKSQDILPKNLLSLGFKGHTELFGPTRLRQRPPPHRKISGPKVWVCAPFLTWNVLISQVSWVPNREDAHIINLNMLSMIEINLLGAFQRPPDPNTSAKVRKSANRALVIVF